MARTGPTRRAGGSRPNMSAWVNRFTLPWLALMAVAALYIILEARLGLRGDAEGEYYPVEVLSRMVVILALMLTWMVHNVLNGKVLSSGDRAAPGRPRFEGAIVPSTIGLYVSLLLLWASENNWLGGVREISPLVTLAVLGIMGLGILAGSFILFLRLGAPLPVALAGLVFLAAGSLEDMAHDFGGGAGAGGGGPGALMGEEALELMGLLFILYFMLCALTAATARLGRSPFIRGDARTLAVSVLFLGVGNAMLMWDKGEVPGAGQLAAGIALMVAGAFVFLKWRKQKLERR